MSKKTFDASGKDLVELAPENWLVLAGRPRAPVRLIDADLASVSRAADKVMLVEDVEPYLFHLEFQAGHDAATLPPKLNVRNALLEDRHGRPVRTVVVALRAEADSPALSGVYRRRFKGEEPYRVFRYDVVRLWKLDPEALLKGGWGTLPLAPVAAKSKAEVPAIIARIRERVDSPGGPGAAGTLWATTLSFLELRYSAEEILMFLNEILPQSKVYQSLTKEGYEKGVKEGVKEGLKEGQLTQGRHLLVLLGTDSFGPPDAETRARIEAIDDLDRLNALALRHRHVQSWNEWLSGSAKPKPTRRPSKKRKGS